MSKQDRDLEREQEEFFWERLKEMPLTEAVEELKLRKNALTEQNRQLQELRQCYTHGQTFDQAGQKLSANCLALSKIGEELREANRKLHEMSWRNAVRAIYGEEGYNKCKEWIVAHECGRD